MRDGKTVRIRLESTLQMPIEMIMVHCVRCKNIIWSIHIWLLDHPFDTEEDKNVGGRYQTIP